MVSPLPLRAFPLARAGFGVLLSLALCASSTMSGFSPAWFFRMAFTSILR